MPMSQDHILAEFSESINPSSVALSSFSAFDTVNGNPLKLFSVYPAPASSTSYFIITQKQDSGRVFRLSVKGVTDSTGNKINPLANSLLFRSSLKQDTIGPRLVSVSIKDSAQAIDFQSDLTMTFSDALATSDSLDWVNLLDSNKKNVPAEKKRISDVVISIRPEKELMNHTWYILRAELRRVHDWAGRGCHDSTKTWRFETLDVEDLSSVDGFVIDENKKDTSGRLYVTAVQVGGNTPKLYLAVTDTSGYFLFPQIAEGRYVFQSFRDRNNNGKYDPGKPFPFIYSERLSSFSDTLKVRARWPLEGVIIKMK